MVNRLLAIPPIIKELINVNKSLMKENPLLIGIVGPCKSGKSILREGLENHGYNPKHIAQEHSYSPSMWQKIVNPDILVYLDVSFETTLIRSKINWTKEEYLKQIQRLNHARRNADFHIDTDDLSQEEVLLTVLKLLRERKK